MLPARTIALTFALGAPAPAAASQPATETTAPSEEVVRLLQRADAAFEDGRLLDALDAIDEAEAKQPGPFYEYMRGLIRQAQGRCDLAVGHWARYLKSEPDESDAADVRRLIEECGGLPETIPPPEPTTVEPTAAEPTTNEPATNEPTPQREPTPVVNDSRRPWMRDVTGGVLLGTGGFSVAAGGGLLLGAVLLHTGAPDGVGLMDHDADLRRAQGLSIASIGATTVGVGLLIGATVRYLRVRRRHPRDLAWLRTSPSRR